MPALSTSVSTSHHESKFLMERTARVYRSIFLVMSENSDQEISAADDDDDDHPNRLVQVGKQRPARGKGKLHNP